MISNREKTRTPPSGATVAMTLTAVRRSLPTSQPKTAALAPARSERLWSSLMLMRFDGLAMGARRGVRLFVWAVGSPHLRLPPGFTSLSISRAVVLTDARVGNELVGGGAG